MRSTNQMITNNSLRNMQTSTQKVDNLTLQLTSGQKIQRASEDPVIAVRALKLRNTVNQLYQYKEKNIKDAESWIELTENSITNVSNYMEYMVGYCNQGATDSFNNDDRNAIAETIRAYKDMIYAEGNATYAGRYIFSGYKTDTAMTFTPAEAPKYSYNITQKLDHSNIDVKKVTVNAVDPADLDEYLGGTKTYGTDYYPEQQQVYRIRLAYDNLSEGTTPTIIYKDGAGTDQTLTVTKTVPSTQSADYYKDLGADEVRYIPETGEIVFGANVYTKIQNTESIVVNYDKENFTTSDLRPEHYFNCIQTNKTSKEVVDFEVTDDDQNIEYEVNFNQKIRVNTLGRDLMSPDVGRSIDELADKVKEVADVESRVRELKALLTNPKYSDNPAAVEQINYMITDAENESKMKNQEMQSLFNHYITLFQDFQTDVTTLQSDSGARGEKLDMIKTRVSDQYANFTELMSANEEVDYEEAAIQYASASTVYNAALQVTSGIIKQTLLDYL